MKNPKLPLKWYNALNEIDFAFQTIINPFTGYTYAVEALIRNTQNAGFTSIDEFFDEAFNDGIIFSLDIELRDKAIKKFKKIVFYKKIKIFYNYDPRIQLMENYRFGATEEILKKNNLRNETICLELSEKHKYEPSDLFKTTFKRIKDRGFKIALDDFGSGFSSLELFYNTEPDFLKFDRFLISNIDTDIKKRSFCSYLLSLAKLFGVIVIAEGIETSREFDICKTLGFDLVQGYFIQKPEMNITEIKSSNMEVVIYNSKNKRDESSDAELILSEITKVDTINETDTFEQLFRKFFQNSKSSFFPVVDSGNCPMGIIHERDIKKYVYSPYGYNLLTNKSISKTFRMFLSKCPIVDINMPQELLLSNFVHNPEMDGIIVTENMEYLGFLSSTSLLKIIHKKNLAFVRELNPLTKLPGNFLISKYINSFDFNSRIYQYYICFDFDNFKPFNDRFGFRQGDRVILIFTEILKKIFFLKKYFLGHIGGDDFFIGYNDDSRSIEYLHELINDAIDNFTDSIISLYTEEEYTNGYYTSRGRDGEITNFPLLSAHAALIELKLNKSIILDNFQDIIAVKLAELKETAKESLNKISIFELDESDFE